MTKKYIPRLYYLDRIKPFMDKGVIKVIVGQRRIGKSYFFYQIMDFIKETRPESEIIYIDKESHEFDHIENSRELLSYIQKKGKTPGKIYVFIDEIQEIVDFERALRSLNASGQYDIYCTGSNARMFAGELATLLSGRCITIEMHSLSYQEFLRFHGLHGNKESFTKYIKYGGLPFLVNLELTDEVVYDYIKNVYNTILLKDVVSRHGIRNVSFLERLVGFLGDNIGCLVSAKSISDFLKSQHIGISVNTVLDYLSYLAEAYFIHKVPRVDIKGKKVFEVNDKYYFEDLGLRHSVVGYSPASIGKVLENIVFLHLKVNGYRVMVGQMGNKEIDFVCEKAGEREYIQVSYLIADDKTEQREFGNLLDIRDNYPKAVVSMDEIITGKTLQGIRHINLMEFLIHPGDGS